IWFPPGTSARSGAAQGCYPRFQRENCCGAAVQGPLRAGSGDDHYGYETKYQRIQVLDLSKSHIHDAVAIACSFGEVVKPSSVFYQVRCVPRGQYQLFNGKRSEHRVWAPRKLKGWKPKGRWAILAGGDREGALWSKTSPQAKRCWR